MQKVFVKIAVLSRQPPVYANQRLIEAGARRSCDVCIVDPLSLPLIFADGIAWHPGNSRISALMPLSPGSVQAGNARAMRCWRTGRRVASSA